MAQDIAEKLDFDLWEPDIYRAPWDLNLDGKINSYELAYATNTAKPEVLLVTGFGETYIKDYVRDLGQKGIQLAAVNLGCPENVPISADVMHRAVFNGLSAVIEHIRWGDDTPLDFVGHSKGFVELVEYVEANPAVCRRITGVAPLGLNAQAEAFGITFLDYRREMKGRLKSSGLLSVMGGHPDVERLAKEFNAGINYPREHDIVAKVRRLYDMGLLTHVVIGQKDTLCPPAECREIVGIDHLIVEAEGGHDPLSSASGLKQVEVAIKIMQSQSGAVLL